MHVVALNLNTDTAKPLFTGKAKSHSKWRGKLNPVFGGKSEHPEKRGTKSHSKLRLGCTSQHTT